eukprot:10873147-Alexandrium_andersonii.AAC.1
MAWGGRAWSLVATTPAPAPFFVVPSPAYPPLPPPFRWAWGLSGPRSTGAASREASAPPPPAPEIQGAA